MLCDLLLCGRLQSVLSAEQNVGPTTNGPPIVKMFLITLLERRKLLSDYATSHQTHADRENIPHFCVRKEEITIRLQNFCTKPA